MKTPQPQAYSAHDTLPPPDDSDSSVTIPMQRGDLDEALAACKCASDRCLKVALSAKMKVAR